MYLRGTSPLCLWGTTCTHRGHPILAELDAIDGAVSLDHKSPLH